MPNPNITIGREITINGQKVDLVAPEINISRVGGLVAINLTIYTDQCTIDPLNLPHNAEITLNGDPHV